MELGQVSLQSDHYFLSGKSIEVDVLEHFSKWNNRNFAQ